MPQTTGGISFVNARVRMSSDSGANYVDISGHLSSLEIDGGERDLGTAHTADGETPIVGIGKRDLLEVNVKTVYTETPGEPYAMLVNAYENNQRIRLQWSLNAFESGTNVFTTDDGYVTSPPYVGGEAGPGDIIMNEWTLKCGRITPSVQA